MASYRHSFTRRIGVWSLALALVCSVVLAGCGGKKNADGTANLTVLLDWYPNAVHSFLIAAEEQGYFKEAGLNVKLQVPAGTDDALKLAATGKADLAFSYQMQVAIGRAEDVPVKSVAAVVRHPLNQLFVPADSGIKSPKDLAGRKIGFPSMPLDEAYVNTMVKADGGDPAKLTYVDIGYDLIPALMTKKVDAIIGGFINHEKLLIEKEGMKLLTFDPTKYGVPDYYELVLVAGDKTYEKKQAAIRAFLAAAAKGQAYVAANPDQALQSLLKKQDKDFPLDADVEKMSLATLLPLMGSGSEPFGSQTEASWKAAIDWLKSTGTIAKDVKPQDVFVQ
ncbi:ABC transporter substrate-binding protein [Paenibacillus cymbidii]|uniref:ABC transporter substrate-binding protein n=1 Tax=Paenibacillus cymbidii TaxID=1639034 RepID=UPI0010820982|nr:ABC transporter substrate-binding protein [Paenibacillus cymbidii]